MRHYFFLVFGISLFLSVAGVDIARAEASDLTRGKWTCAKSLNAEDAAVMLFGDDHSSTIISASRKDGELSFMFIGLTLKEGELYDSGGHGWDHFTLAADKQNKSFTRKDDDTNKRHYASISGRAAREVDALFRQADEAAIVVYVHGMKEVFKRQTFTLRKYAEKVQECTK